MLHGGGCLGDILHLSDVLDFAEGGHHILAVPKVKLSLYHTSILHQGKAALEGGAEGGGGWQSRHAQSP